MIAGRFANTGKRTIVPQHDKNKMFTMGSGPVHSYFISPSELQALSPEDRPISKRPFVLPKKNAH
ncbi:hypothetical protein ASF12_22755 [Paenibacillus sp. Leaf72]|nr:hypothetical protein ASF12_22755 [Paenibacillus sp. Leaf72]